MFRAMPDPHREPLPEHPAPRRRYHGLRLGGPPPIYRGPAEPVLRRHEAQRRPRVDCDTNIPIDTARKIAAALIEAADEIDGLT
jgi:hypothetical protein